jgi:aspartate/methionine/tyrosine aminotransferase
MDKRIQPADRLNSVTEYYFSRKLKQIAALNASGADIVSLGIGGPDMPPPQAAIDAAVACLKRRDTHSYQMTVGRPELRRAFADWYSQRYGVEWLDPDKNILPLIGSKEGVLNISMAFINPGDGVLVPNPGYPTYTSASRLAGAEIFNYELSEKTGWYPDFDALERLPLERIKLMWVNYPHMPTGTPASKDVFRKLVDFGRRYGILIINDNPYSFILNDAPQSILQVEGATDVAMELNSLSKCLSMAGWRVGMLIGAPEYIGWVLRVKSNIDSGQPLFVMKGAVAALQSGDEWYKEINAAYGARQAIAHRIMDALGCECRGGQQGLFLWGRIPNDKVSAEAYADEILDKARVFVTPGFIFGSQGERYIRISLCAPENKLNEALNRIETCL